MDGAGRSDGKRLLLVAPLASLSTTAAIAIGVREQIDDALRCVEGSGVRVRRS